MTDIRIKLGLSEELLARVDEARGMVPRERWIRHVVEEACAEEVIVISGQHVASGQKLTSTRIVYKHDFKPRSTNPTRCFVCGKSRQDHD